MSLHYRFVAALHQTIFLPRYQSQDHSLYLSTDARTTRGRKAQVLLQKNQIIKMTNFKNMRIPYHFSVRMQHQFPVRIMHSMKEVQLSLFVESRYEYLKCHTDNTSHKRSYNSCSRSIARTKLGREEDLRLKNLSCKNTIIIILIIIVVIR